MFERTGTMQIRIEFYGIPRQRAGVGTIDVSAVCLSQALAAVARRLPEFGTTCISHGKLASGITANVNGDLFVSDGDCPLKPGDTLLILSADAGG